MKRIIRAALLVIPAAAFAQSKAPAGPSPAGADRGNECLIEPWQRIEIHSPVEALIAAIPVDRGSQVRKGDLLVQLEAAVEEAALAGSRYRATMEGQVKSAESRLAYARIKHARREELKQQNFISGQDKDEAEAEMRVAEAALQDARENLKAATLEARRLEEMVRQRKLKSPFTGVITDRLQHPGELARSVEGSKPILKMAQTDVLRVEVLLPVARYGTVRVGQRAEVTPEPPIKGQFTATVQVVDRVVDSASSTFGVRLQLSNPKGDIPGGVRCRIRFQ